MGSKKIKNLKLRTYISTFFLWFALIILAQAPEGYYNNAIGKKDAALKTALHNITRKHTYLNYDANWTIWWGREGESNGYFQKTDWHPDGYYWDMYSDDKHDVYYVGGTVQNKEHSMPRSWWGASGSYGDANGDLHNLFPSNRRANNAKSNHPLGITDRDTLNNGVSKVGRSALSGYSGTVFEPADEYKGDFARTYMYMVTCYQDYWDKWQGTGTTSMLQKNAYPVFNGYAVNLLMLWHRNDTVSEKETNRNNAVYALQGNRNPFVDFPELAEYIWGNQKGKAWGRNDFYVGYDKEEKILYVELNGSISAEYIVYNISGVAVLADKFHSDSTINLSQFPKGVYIILVYNEAKREARKVFIN